MTAGQWLSSCRTEWRSEWFHRVLPISETKANEMAVSGIGTIAAARVLPKDGEAFVAISMYA